MSNALQVIKQETFGSVLCDFYQNESGNVFMTRDQIGTALEYAEAGRAIEVIHRRNKDRLDRFSVTVKLTGTDGKLYDTYIYSAKGIYEICRFSRQPKADAFMDWVWDVIETIRKSGMYINPSSNNILNVLNQAHAFTSNMIAAGTAPAVALEAARSMYKAVGIVIPRLAETAFYTGPEIAKMVGIRCKKESYVKYVMGRIINECRPEKDECRNAYDPDDEEIIKRYAESVIYKVDKWLIENSFPPVISVRRDDKDYLYEIAYSERQTPDMQKALVSSNPNSSESMALTIKDIQVMLGISHISAYCLARRADFPLIRIGKKYVIPRKQFMEWLDKNAYAQLNIKE